MIWVIICSLAFNMLLLASSWFLRALGLNSVLVGFNLICEGVDLVLEGLGMLFVGLDLVLKSGVPVLERLNFLGCSVGHGCGNEICVEARSLEKVRVKLEALRPTDELTL